MSPAQSIAAQFRAAKNAEDFQALVTCVLDGKGPPAILPYLAYEEVQRALTCIFTTLEGQHARDRRTEPAAYHSLRVAEICARALAACEGIETKKCLRVIVSALLHDYLEDAPQAKAIERRIKSAQEHGQTCEEQGLRMELARVRAGLAEDLRPVLGGRFDPMIEIIRQLTNDPMPRELKNEQDKNKYLIARRSQAFQPESLIIKMADLHDNAERELQDLMTGRFLSRQVSARQAVTLLEKRLAVHGRISKIMLTMRQSVEARTDCHKYQRAALYLHEQYEATVWDLGERLKKRREMIRGRPRDAQASTHQAARRPIASSIATKAFGAAVVSGPPA